jgi:hypothetical protein
LRPLRASGLGMGPERRKCIDYPTPYWGLRVKNSPATSRQVRQLYLRLCCKTRKLPGDTFPAKSRSDRRPSIGAVSIALPRSPVRLPSGDEVPHIFTRKSRVQPGRFLIGSAKRLLQQYPSETGHAGGWPARQVRAAKSGLSHCKGHRAGPSAVRGRNFRGRCPTRGSACIARRLV